MITHINQSPKAIKQAQRVAAGKLPPTLATAVETEFRHSAWTNKRTQVAAALKTSHVTSSAIDTFNQCGSSCVVEFSKSENRHRLRGNFCKCRHCEPCARSKANRMAKNLKARLLLAPSGRYRFITLTLKHSDRPLVLQIRHLYASFKKLRRSKTWRTTQIGGAAVLECKYNSEDKRWHPHLHVIAEGGYIDKSDLSSAWKKATGDSYIIDIRALKSGKDAAHYVAKYVAKGTSNNVWHDPAVAKEWVTSTRSLRTATTYASWRGYKLLAPPEDPGDWKEIDYLDKIIADAKAGQEYARALILSLRPPGKSEEACLFNPTQ